MFSEDGPFHLCLYPDSPLMTSVAHNKILLDRGRAADTPGCVVVYFLHLAIRCCVVIHKCWSPSCSSHPLSVYFPVLGTEYPARSLPRKEPLQSANPDSYRKPSSCRYEKATKLPSAASYSHLIHKKWCAREDVSYLLSATLA